MKQSEKNFWIVIGTIAIMILIYTTFFGGEDASQEHLDQMIKEKVCAPEKIVSVNTNSNSKTAMIVCSD